MTVMHNYLRRPLPKGCLPKPSRTDDFGRAVPWLLSRQLLAALKYIALYSGYGDQLDHKDWMRPEEQLVPDDSKNTEFWFDYIADSGDGQLPMYNIAFLALNDVWLDRSSGRASFGPTTEGQRLPRGAFLFVGGDTAYHMADYATLAERFWRPFCWAWGEVATDPPRRPLYGIPGNHDYYDALHGFNRQFRRSLAQLTSWKMPLPPLDIPAFERKQDASYVALKLPFGWWLWGVDAQDGHLDLRQRHFFNSIVERDGVPNRLIVATPEPTTVFGRRPQPNEPHVKLFEQLGLETPFVQGHAALAAQRIRLDISGDTHHYARHWGPQGTPNAQAASNYASVVSGAGGAFMHPSDTRLGDLQPQCLYPAAITSRREVMARLFSPRCIVHGGLVWLVAGIVVLGLTFATTLPTTRAFLRVLAAGPYLGSIISGPLKALSGSQSWDHRLDIVAACATTSVGNPWWVLGFAVLVVVSLLVPVFTVWKLPDNESETERSFAIAHVPVYAGLAVAVVILFNMPTIEGEPDLEMFIADLYLIGGWIIFAATMAWSNAYTGRLARKALHRRIRTREYLPAWYVPIFGVVTVLVVHWYYGMAPVWLLASDALVLVLALICSLGLVAAAILVGAPERSARYLIGFGSIGVVHALVQGALPVLLVRFGSLERIVAAVIVLLAVSFLGRWIASRLPAFVLLAAWIGVAAVEFVIALAGTDVIELTSYRLILAAFLGAFFGCAWFGWYLAVSLVFNGHNNEAGGASRIEKYKQLVRIKLTEDSLTAYVIGIDAPNADASSAALRLVDTFVLKAP